MKFARVVINNPSIYGEYDYHIDSGLEDQVRVGHLVRVGFGQQITQGVVIKILSETVVGQTKPVLELIDPIPVVTMEQIELAFQLAGHTLNSVAVFIYAMLPPGLSQHADFLYSLHHQVFSAGRGNLSAIQERLTSLLENRGELRGRQLDRHFHNVDWRPSMQSLLRGGYVQRQSILPAPTVRPKYIITAQLAVSPEIAQAAMPFLGKTPATLLRRQKALQFLLDEPEPVAVSWVYAESGCNIVDLQELAEKQLIVLLECEIFRDPLSRLTIATRAKEVKLTEQQDLVLSQVIDAMEENDTKIDRENTAFLLHGVTGSGKTEVYLQASAEALRRGKSVIILVPEISLTPQLVRQFTTSFPGQVGLMHSKLSTGERYDTWRRARSGQIRIIIGPRSALFVPLANIGLIVLDECHDNSYYQAEPPFYHAVWAAEKYAKICNAVCVLGSATPSIELKYRSEFKTNDKVDSLRSLELKTRIAFDEKEGKVANLPPVTIVDMRDELKSGNRGIFSRFLLEGLAEVMERGEQAILFINRRGAATYVFCRDCGFVLRCPRCETPLTYHLGASSHLPGSSVGSDATLSGLRCHHCNYSRQMVIKCPVCKGDKVRSYGLGSEKVESEVMRIFPNARVMRWDWDTTREKNSHEMMLTHFSNRQVDILVGTQMLAKGFDFPFVTLVGIVMADVGINLPDPFAGERTFQLLTQVAGRAGRSDRGGRVVLQTYMPENSIIQMASHHDYSSFYKLELQNRRMLGYPPFIRVIRLEYRHHNNEYAKKQAVILAEELLKSDKVGESSKIEIIGPVPCFYQKVDGYYRWQIILRGENPVSLFGGRAPDGWRVEVEPVSLL